MIGSTAGRVSLSAVTLNLDLVVSPWVIETNRDRFFVIKERKLTDYLAQIA